MSFQTVKIHGFFVTMNSFNGLVIEDLTNCGTNDFGSGLQTRLYYAPASFFKRINLPSPSEDFQNVLLLENSFIEFQNENCGWAFVDLLIDENEVKSSIVGNNQRKKNKTSLDVFILGLRSRVLGFLYKMQNEPMVFCIPTSDNISILIGNLRNRAFIEQANGTSGKQYEENSGIAASISCNSVMYFFRENLNIQPIDPSDPNIPTIGKRGGFIDVTQDY